MMKEMFICARHQHGVWQARRFSDTHYGRLHLGCGSQVKAGWPDIDLDSQTDVMFDLRRPLSLPNNQIGLIY
jgi:hypothetical protein